MLYRSLILCFYSGFLLHFQFHFYLTVTSVAFTALPQFEAKYALKDSLLQKLHMHEKLPQHQDFFRPSARHVTRLRSDLMIVQQAPQRSTGGPLHLIGCSTSLSWRLSYWCGRRRIGWRHGCCTTIFGLGVKLVTYIRCRYVSHLDWLIDLGWTSQINFGRERRRRLGLQIISPTWGLRLYLDPRSPRPSVFRGGPRV